MIQIEIEHIRITPNPVYAKKNWQISLEVTDREITYQKDPEYAGQLYSGQKIGVI